MTDITLEKVTIPTWADPFRVIVNGKIYYYPAGETLEVPYEVAEVIRQLERDPSLPPSSGGGGSGGGGADILNENGIIKQKHLPEGYPYSEIGKGYILPETAWDTTGGPASISSPISVKVGETYTVNYNGTNYECIAVDLASLGTFPYGGCVFGDISEFTGGESTGEPFILMCFSEETYTALGAGGMMTTTDGATNGTISVSGIGEIITPLAAKLLPDNLPKRVEKLESSIGANKEIVLVLSDFRTNVWVQETQPLLYFSGYTFDELAEAAKRGKLVFADATYSNIVRPDFTIDAENRIIYALWHCYIGNTAYLLDFAYNGMSPSTDPYFYRNMHKSWTVVNEGP